MAICKSATRYDKDSYYETTVDESNDNVVVKGIKNGEPVEWSLGSGGGGDILVATIHSDASSTNVSIDKTFSELKVAMENGTPVYGRFVTTYNNKIISVGVANSISLAQLGSQNVIIFDSVAYKDNGGTPATITEISHATYTLLSDDTLTMKIAEKQFS